MRAFEELRSSKSWGWKEKAGKAGRLLPNAPLVNKQMSGNLKNRIEEYYYA